MSKPDPADEYQRAAGRRVFLNAMDPLRVAQTEGFRQGLLKAAELVRANPDSSGCSLSILLDAEAAKLPVPPVATKGGK